ncbi:MAG: L,D-transpeptidase [Myxococcales bacterium]|nr:L,D-transpeptidase [Myxococcales bacterium]MCB9708010.1 L,D-transpeptidase [Myxococcales bacterium]
MVKLLRRILSLCLVLMAAGLVLGACDRRARKDKSALGNAGRTVAVSHSKTKERSATLHSTSGAPSIETIFPLTGIVTWHTARIFAAPSSTAQVIGYARRGTQFRAALVAEGEGCKSEWYRVPGDGFVCTSQGYYIGRENPLAETAPMPPALDSALPYPYGRVVRDNALQYWKLPSREEESAAQRMLDILKAKEELPLEMSDPAVIVDPTKEAVVPESEATIPEEPEQGLPDYVRMRMKAGYYVSLDCYEDHEGDEFFRTVRGGYLRSQDIIEVEAPPMRGVITGESWSLPLGFVWRSKARALQQQPEQTYRFLYDLPRHTVLAVQETSHLYRGQNYVVTREHIAIRRTAVRVAERRARPALVPKDAKWIHINVPEQTLVAYEGDKPVFVTLVSSGREEFKTPLGIFRLVSKHVTATMDDFANSDEAYSIEDVPWVMYFQGSYALHGTFWHNRFGAVRSHGCVNLSPVDARWLFQWSSPELPYGWHGVMADTAARAGTWVVIDDTSRA